MRHGGVGKGVFSGDYDPPQPWRLFGIKLRLRGIVDHATERTVGGLTNAELEWVARVVVAELQARHSKAPDAMPGPLVIAAPR